MQSLVETQEVYTNFYTFEGIVHALNGVSIIVNQGETYGLVGESGCGKSVTVRSIMRIVQEPGKIEDGRILLFFNAEDRKHGIEILSRSEAFMESIRGNEISMIFQEASTALNPVFTVERQIGESFHFHRLHEMLEVTIEELESEIRSSSLFLFRWWKKLQIGLFRREVERLDNYEKQVATIDSQITKLEERNDPHSLNKKAALSRMRERLGWNDPLVEMMNHIPFLRRFSRRLNKTIRRYVIDLLKQLGVPNPENTVHSYPHELSGGMQQRIVIAIALACHPKLLIADEPTSNLDVTIQAQIMELIKLLKKTTISSVLFITHDLGLVAELCDRVSVMYAGDLCETAAVKELFHNPLHPYTRGLLNSVPKIEQQETLETITGTVPNLINPPTGCRFHPRCPNRMEICSTAKPSRLEYEEGHYVSCYLYTTGKMPNEAESY